ncbi:septal ring lytic transglycosylase RlpA family protein [Methylobacillus flagellatus]|uniref:Endolytic peptidoglycan transglycosylase RlpA n=1 Tax=Methylobacillus flagellatus (strain ATCC 51484 / DSM 6875 / VKM B-1610 / KT) TaxID=265072 RepID=Q1GYC6_METFK|nr:septal ring lytic transglycosylase RlpA family protein [Methylobacillus flagellatus]ABE50761.1 rare lipoprotein A [Methylobacillus flagellatus KT]
MKLIRNLIPGIIALTMAACGGGSSVKPEASKPAPTTQSTPKKGGYYLDDGPGDNPPADIDSIPDAKPRAETPLPRANRPYTALGRRYTPLTEHTPYKQRGIASWYGKRYHGQKTSSGEVYDMYAMTGAHTILPLPSYVRVTNPENGRSVIVRINDRGPFHDNRLIDLSYAAAYKLRLVEKGSGIVEVEALDEYGQPISAPAGSPVDQQARPALAEAGNGNLTNAMSETVTTPPITGAYVQVGAFSIKANGDRLVETLQQSQLANDVQIENWYNAGTYRVRLGPYNSRQQAEAAAEKIKQTLNTNAIVVYQ